MEPLFLPVLHSFENNNHIFTGSFRRAPLSRDPPP